MKISHILSAIAVSAILVCSSCEKKEESFSYRLNMENKATNWYLSQHKICMDIPEDKNFEIGSDAPFYRMDNEGFVYMQVVNPGNPDSRPQEGDIVYFRFMRTNLNSMYQGAEPEPEGNADNMQSPIGATSLVYGNKLLESTTQYGTGIQIPLDYLGYDCEVNLVIRSYSGFIVDQSQCIPYLYNVKYYKAEY